MARTRNIPDYALLPSSQGRYVIDTFRGQFRIRSWPRKRGKSTNPVSVGLTSRFRDATEVMRFAPALLINQAINVARGKGLYPRDVMGHAIMQGMVDIVDDDGNWETHWEPRLEQVLYQGCRITKSTNQNIGGAAFTRISFDTPIIQTVPMWSAGTPNRITVPTGVNIVQVKGGYRGNTVTTLITQLVIRKNGGTFWAESTCDNDSTPAGQVDTGPIPVVAGDYFELWFFGAAAQQIAGVERTFLSVDILNTP